MNITTSKQAEKLAEIGAQFKRIRQDKELSIPHLTATTLISERYLRAIEDGEIDSLPEPVYVRGFIRKYGTALGVGDLSEDFPLNPVLPEQKWVGSAAAELRPLHLYALYIGVIAGAVSLLATFLNSPDANKINDSQTILGNAAQINPPKTNPPATADSLLPKISGLEVLRQTVSDSSIISSTVNNFKFKPALQATNDQNSKTNSNKLQSDATFGEVSSSLNNAIKSWSNNINFQNGAATNSEIDAKGNFEFSGNKPVNIGIVMKGQSWLRIVVDGKTEFEGVLDEGKKLAWSGDRQISIRAGNASAVGLSYNNQQVKILGKEGEVAERLFGLNQSNTLENKELELRGFLESMSNN
ncbi:MAG: helix-turn-helix domain-containing protein [Pseudanabaena sp.]